MTKVILADKVNGHLTLSNVDKSFHDNNYKKN